MISYLFNVQVALRSFELMKLFSIYQYANYSFFIWLKLSSLQAEDNEDEDYFDDVSLKALKNQHLPEDTDMVEIVEGGDGGESDVDDDDNIDDVAGRGRRTSFKEYTYTPKVPGPFQPASTIRHTQIIQENEVSIAECNYLWAWLIVKILTCVKLLHFYYLQSRRAQWAYLVWNSVGSITCLNEDTNNRIEISFSDVQGPNKAITFEETDMFTRAALSEYGAVFASEPSDGDIIDAKDRVAAVVLYKAFHSASQGLQPNETFRYSLPLGEGVTGVACGKGFVAVATTTGFLRLFSATGKS